MVEMEFSISLNDPGFIKFFENHDRQGSSSTTLNNLICYNTNFFTMMEQVHSEFWGVNR